MDKAQAFILRSIVNPEQQQQALAQCLSKITKLAVSGLQDLFSPCASETHFFYLCVITDCLREIQALYFPLLECRWPPQTLPYANEKAFMVNPNLTDRQRINELSRRIYQAESLTRIASEELFLESYSNDQVNFRLSNLYSVNSQDYPHNSPIN